MSQFDELSRQDIDDGMSRSDSDNGPSCQITENDGEASDLFGSMRLSVLAKHASFIDDHDNP